MLTKRKKILTRLPPEQEINIKKAHKHKKPTEEIQAEEIQIQPTNRNERDSFF